MQEINIDSHPMSLDRLLDLIDAGQLAIPDFQRPFVWSDQQVISLLGTVLNGWPAGSLLLMRGETDIFRVREFEFAPPLTKVKFVVLDGQQRLTALYSALRDAGESVFLVDLESNYDEESDDEGLGVEERIRSTTRSRLRRARTAMKNPQTIPMAALRSPADFYEWRDAVVDRLREAEATRFKETATSFYRQNLSAVHRYQFPAVILDGSLPVTAVARIFEKVNKTGTFLSTFDLMVARVYEPDWNLRDLWAELREEEPVVKRLLPDGMPLLEAISLHHGENVKRSAVLNLSPRLVRGEWESVRDAAVKATDFLTAEFGVIRGNWLPYRVMLVALTALAMDNDLASIQELPRWFWSRAFGLGYDVASSTRVATDYRRLVARTFAEQTQSWPVSEAVLTNATRRSQRALFGSFLSLMASRGPKELLALPWQTEPLNSVRGSAEEDQFLVASIFPTGLGVARFEAPPHLRILGLALVSPQTNRRLKDVGLAQLLTATSQEPDRAQLDEALASQFLPPSSQIAEYGSDWRALLRARVDLVLDALKTEWSIPVERLSTDEDSGATP